MRRRRRHYGRHTPLPPVWEQIRRVLLRATFGTVFRTLAASAVLTLLIWLAIGALTPDRLATVSGGLFGDRQPSVRGEAASVVEVYEFGFTPNTTKIEVGEAVSWKAVGKEQHIVTPSSGGTHRVFFKAQDFGTARHVFDKPGRYPYHCSLHPQMKGTVVVVE